MLLLAAFLAAGCAKYNTYYNAKKAFDEAERVRDEAIRKNEDPPPPVGTQKTNYDLAIRKAQKVLDEYPGHDLTDDALFLQAKAWHRLESYRMSIRKLDLLFVNYPATQYLEESLYLQGLNYLLIGAAARSQEYLDRLQRKFPESDYRAEVLKVSGDNAFALQDWHAAAEAYESYLLQQGTLQERDRIGLKLAECHWEMEQFYEASAVLQEVGQNAQNRELRFRALLLKARVHVQIGDFDAVDLLLRELRSEAELYNVRGDVRLIEAESLIAQGRGDEAAPLLESMPQEWETPDVKARSRDMLGFLYMERDDWEEASRMFLEALRRRQVLDDPELTRLYSESLRDYLAADQSLADARSEDVSRFKLLQANSMLFGFDRPALAADLYREAAADADADSTIAARALYGAYLAYGERLDNPDSAAIFAEALEDRFPDSPQAYEVRSGGGDLFGYLLARRSDKQAAAYAALSDSARASLVAGFGATAGGSVVLLPESTSKMRRRMIYLQRRDNMVYAPNREELAAAAQHDLSEMETLQRQAAQDSLQAAAIDTTGAPPPGSGAAVVLPPPGQDTGVAAETGSTAEDGTGALAGSQEGAEGTAEGEEAAGAGEKDEDEKDDEDDDKKKKDEDEHDLW